MPAIREGLDQLVAVVPIPGNDEIRRCKTVQQPSRNGVFLREAVMRDIARMNDGIGLRIRRVDVLNARLEIRRSGRVVTRDVGIGELNDPHGRSPKPANAAAADPAGNFQQARFFQSTASDRSGESSWGMRSDSGARVTQAEHQAGRATSP